MVENFRGRYKGETHAEPQQAAGVGDVGRLGDLLVLHEPLGVGILDEDVEHDEVVLGVVQDGLHHGTRAVAAVEALGQGPLVIRTKPRKYVYVSRWYLWKIIYFVF